MRGWQRAGVLAMCCVALLCGSAKADTVLFSDTLQGSLSDGNWSTNASGEIVQDPLDASGYALTFTQPRGGGDLWSTDITGPGGTYTAGFYFLATCENEYQCGAFFGGSGLSSEWVASDTPFGSNYLFADTPVWTWVTFQFTAGTDFQIKMEDFAGSPGNGYDVVFFKDLEVASGSDPLAAPGMGATPEPGSLALLGTGLAGLGVMRRRLV